MGNFHLSEVSQALKQKSATMARVSETAEELEWQMV
jgi:hypothetical protein